MAPPLSAEEVVRHQEAGMEAVGMEVEVAVGVGEGGMQDGDLRRYAKGYIPQPRVLDESDRVQQSVLDGQCL